MIKMKYKYCSNCFSINTKFNALEKKDVCLSCNFKGNFKEDSIDMINHYKKQDFTNINKENEISQTTEQPKANVLEDISLNQRIKNKFGKQTNNTDWELL